MLYQKHLSKWHISSFDFVLVLVFKLLGNDYCDLTKPRYTSLGERTHLRWSNLLSDRLCSHLREKSRLHRKKHGLKMLSQLVSEGYVTVGLGVVWCGISALLCKNARFCSSLLCTYRISRKYLWSLFQCEWMMCSRLYDFVTHVCE